MADKQEDSVNVVEARAKLAEKFGDQSRLGGKGTQRRKKKAVHKTQVTDDKKLKPIIKKFGVQPLPGIDEVNMFKDDNTVLNFKHPEVMASLQTNTFVVMGKPETKQIKEMLPDIMAQLGPKQWKSLKDILGNLAPKKEGEKIDEAAKEEEEDVPNLVGENFEEISKKAD